MRLMTVRIVAITLALGLILVGVVPPSRAQGIGPGGSQEYRIGPGDLLEIDVLGESELSRTLTVQPDGRISLPLVGPVMAAGLTATQLSDLVAAQMKRFVKNPQVLVIIRQSVPRKGLVYLVGEAGHPGTYELEEGWTIANLLGAAGGPTAKAGLQKVVIIRKGTTIYVDLERLLAKGDVSQNVALEAGDVVIIPEIDERVHVLGGVAKPGSYHYKPGDRVVDLLFTAGGPTGRAVLGEVGVIRQSGGKATVTIANLDKFLKDGDFSQNVPLLPGDFVFVPERTGVNWEAVLGGLGSLATIFLLWK